MRKKNFFQWAITGVILLSIAFTACQKDAVNKDVINENQNVQVPEAANPVNIAARDAGLQTVTIQTTPEGNKELVAKGHVALEKGTNTNFVMRVRTDGTFDPTDPTDPTDPLLDVIICDGKTFRELSQDIRDRNAAFKQTAAYAALQNAANRWCRTFFYCIENCMIAEMYGVAPQYPCQYLPADLEDYLVKNPILDGSLVGTQH